MEIGLRDLAYILGLASTALVLWTRLRKSASDVAVWRREMELKVEGLKEKLAAHRDEHRSDADEAREFRKKVYEFMSEMKTRVSNIEMVMRVNGGIPKVDTK